ATDRRTFVVRSDGYRDKPIVVDLTAPPHEIHITLERDAPVDDAKSPPKAKATTKTNKTKSKSDKVDKTDKPAETIHHDDSLEKIDPTKKDPGIDPADTHDPFHRHAK